VGLRREWRAIARVGMERREAPPPCVNRGRGRFASVPAGYASPSRGLASPWRLPALHSPFGETEKGTPAHPRRKQQGRRSFAFLDLVTMLYVDSYISIDIREA
jgi:hypothetical protein